VVASDATPRENAKTVAKRMLQEGTTKIEAQS
jgi:hypothetical protein